MEGVVPAGMIPSFSETMPAPPLKIFATFICVGGYTGIVTSTYVKLFYPACFL